MLFPARLLHALLEFYDFHLFVNLIYWSMNDYSMHARYCLENATNSDFTYCKEIDLGFEIVMADGVYFFSLFEAFYFNIIEHLHAC